MTFAATGTAPNITITQTGTDTSLAGLAGLAGVTTIGVDSRIYRLSGAKLVVNGTLTLTPTAESLVFDETCPETELSIGGSLTIGAASSVPWGIPAITCLRKAATWQSVQIQVTGSGAVTWHYGTISTRGSVNIPATAGACTFNGLLHLGMTASQPGRLNLYRTVTFGARAVVSGNGIQAFGDAALSNLTIADTLSIGIHLSTATSLTAPYVISGVSLLGGANVYPWGAQVWHLKGMAGGGNVPKTAGGAPAGVRPLIQTFGRADLTVTSGGAAVSGASVISRDTNNGARGSFSVGSDSVTFNGVPDTTVTAVTGAGGSTGVLELLLQNWSLNNGTPVVDWRGLSSGANTRGLYICSYGHRLSSTVVDMTAAGTVSQPVFLDADPSVTLPKASAAALAGVATLDDVYDVLKLWRCTAPNLEYPAPGVQVGTTSGTALDIGTHSLVLNPSAPAVVAVAGGVITVKGSALAAGTKHASIKSTGTVTATGGGAITAPIVDANGDSYLSFSGIDSWIVYSDPARTVQVGAGTGAQLFRFVYAPGVTYYLKCVAGSTEFAMVSSPSAAGETEVTLSTQALLTALQGKVADVKSDTGFIKLLVL